MITQVTKTSHLAQTLHFCVVEDDPSFRDTFASVLEQYGDVEQIATPKLAIQYLKNNHPDLLFVDLNFYGKKDGPSIIEFAAKKYIYTVVVSSYEDDETIAECIKLGAKDYYVKGDELNVIKDIILRYQKNSKNLTNNEFTETSHPLFKKNLEFLLDNAKSNYPVLLNGPTGTGKTFFAKKIHQKSAVPGKFVAMNCSSIQKDLFESEMFGHVKGAFSGAIENYEGKIQEANNGTLYLDEIDSMPLEQQAKLLKVIEEKEFYPVGSNKIKKVHFRLIASAQKDLRQMIHNGEFREDLYYRISFIETRIMPLSERAQDIVPLLKIFLKGPRRYYMTEEFKLEISRYNWPGNIRELQIFAANIKLGHEAHLTGALAQSLLYKSSSATSNSSFFSVDQLQLLQKIGLDEFIKTAKKEAIETTLSHYKNDVNMAIQTLKLTTPTFYRLKKSLSEAL